MIDDCAAVTALLVRAAERTSSNGSAGSDEDARLSAHLEECPSCRAELADQRAMREMLQSYPVQGARLGFDTRVMAAIRAEADSGASSWLGSLDFRRWTWRLVPVAAALALASIMVNRADVTTQAGDETTLGATASTDSLPVSSALWSESVSESSLLSLMLTANVDDTLATYRKDQ
jgi:predicted anti-sigma-YlaC factor YlaD